MRKPGLIAAGVAAAGVLAVAGITSTAPPTGVRTGPVAATRTGAPTTVSQADAERIALARVPGSTVTGARLGTDNGHDVWTVHLSTADAHIDVRVDAETGDVRADDAVGDDSGGVDDHGRPGSDGSDDDHANGHGDDDAAGHE